MKKNKIKWINATAESYKILNDSLLDFIETLPDSENDISNILDYKDVLDAEEYLITCKKYIYRIISELEGENRLIDFSLAYAKRHEKTNKKK